MTSTFSDDRAAITECQSLADLRACVIRAAENLGFPNVSMTLYVEVGDDQYARQTLVDHVPPEFREVWLDVQKARADPTTQWTKRSSLPLVWNRDFYEAHGALDLYREQAPYGFEEGVIHAVHLAEGRHIAFGVDSPSGRLPRTPEGVIRTIADAHLLAVYAEGAADRLTKAPSAAEAEVVLSPREREALLWTLAGKTAWESGMIMGVAERTANQYLASASRKLGCVGKHAAAVKAMDLGLIRR